MIGRLYGVANWTDLCVKGLQELASKYQGPWCEPLIPPTHQANGLPIPTAEMTVKPIEMFRCRGRQPGQGSKKKKIVRPQTKEEKKAADFIEKVLANGKH